MTTRANQMANSVIVTRGCEESADFNRALIEATEKDLRPHCSDPKTNHFWLSESLTERRTAVRLSADDAR